MARGEAKHYLHKYEVIHEATHASAGHLRWMAKHVEGMPAQVIGDLSIDCEACSACKTRNKGHANQLSKRRYELDEVWEADTSFGYHQPGPRGETMAVFFVDKGGRRRDAYPCVRRQDAHELLRTQVKIRGKPRAIQVDKGCELNGGRFLQECLNLGIKLLAVPTEEHELQGLVESAASSTRRTCATIMKMSGADEFAPEMWTYALVYAAQLHFFTGRHRQLNITPYEAYHGKKPDLKKLFPFGCLAWVTYLPKQRSKSEPTARKCIFLGLNREHNAYVFYDYDVSNVFESRDAYFKPQVFPLLMPKEREEVERIPRSGGAAKTKPQQEYLPDRIHGWRRPGQVGA